MSNINSFTFPLGAIVSIITNSGIVYVGTLLEVRHCNDSNEPGLQFLFLQLTIAVEPYVVGELVAININEITSIGPIIIS